MSLTDNPRSLVAPGEGLLAVTSGSDDKTLAKLFNVEAWPKEIKARLENDWVIVGCPSDAGGGICRGAAHGPRAIRSWLYREYPAYAAHDIGDVPCIPQLLHDRMYTKAQLDASYEALFSEPRKAGQSVSPLNLLADLLAKLYVAGKKVFILGGDHSVSWAPFEAMKRAKTDRQMGVLHFDAHTDLMEHRFGVELCYSTWAAHSLDQLDNPSNWFQVGLRTSRLAKKDWEAKFGIRQVWMSEIARRSPEHWARRIADEWRKNHVKHFYISLDIDVLDPKFAPSTGTPERGGLGVYFVKTLIRELRAQFPLFGADLVEVAPRIGSAADANKTLQSAVDCMKAILP